MRQHTCYSSDIMWCCLC